MDGNAGYLWLSTFPRLPDAWKGEEAMKRYILVLMALMLLTVPLLVGAGDEGWMPPEWNPTPPARPTIDLVQLVQLLLAKGVISDQDYAQLIQSPSSSPAQPPHARGWTWYEVYRNPVQSKP
jgi:hypothetical protein